MKSVRIAVLGANGQLGIGLRNNLQNCPPPSTQHWDFFSSEELDITQKGQLVQKLEERDFDYVVNCAAYTAVDGAEKHFEQAEAINTTAVKGIAQTCKDLDIILIHISTDFVFDGEKKSPYLETDLTNPLGVYGMTKLQGEKHIQHEMEKYFILRTGWLYSLYGKNFYRTIKDLLKERKEITVVNDQIGTPTHTTILIQSIRLIIDSASASYGLFHVGNNGKSSWFDFARLIGKTQNSTTEIKPIPTSSYPTSAKRPAYSVLDKSKFEKTFHIHFPDWRESFYKMLDC